MKKITSIFLAVDLALSLATCNIKVGETETRKEVKKIVSEHVSECIQDIKEINTNTKAEVVKVKEKCKEEIKIDCDVVENLGVFSLTFYTPYEDEWGYTTATGVRSQHLKTCAVDPRVIPYGSVIQITGNNGKTLTLRAVDCGGGIKGNKIDIFFDGGQREGYAFIESFGQIHSVYLLEE